MTLLGGDFMPAIFEKLKIKIISEEKYDFSV